MAAAIASAYVDAHLDVPVAAVGSQGIDGPDTSVQELGRVLEDLKHGAVAAAGLRPSSYDFQDNRHASSSSSVASSRASLRVVPSNASLRSTRSRRSASASSDRSDMSATLQNDANDSPSRRRSQTARPSPQKQGRDRSHSSASSAATASIYRSSRPASGTYSDDGSIMHGASGSAFLNPHLAKRVHKKAGRPSAEREDHYHADEAARAYCTCCCDKEDCQRAIRAAREWADTQDDLRLAAEIGQALLKKHDEAAARMAKMEADYTSQRDALMTKLSSSIKESSSLQRQLAQSILNLDAADASNRTLLHELDEARGSLAKLRREHAKCAMTAARADKLSKELDDVRQESISMRKREEASASLAKRVGRRNEELVEQLKHKSEELEAMSRRERVNATSSDAMERAKERLRMDSAAAAGAKTAHAELAAAEDAYKEMLQTLVQESESLKEENRYLKEMLEAKNEEAAVLREAHVPRSFGSMHGSHQRSLSLATSASIASQPAQLHAPLASASDAFNDSAPLGDELMAAARGERGRDSPKPSLLISPPMRTSPLPDMHALHISHTPAIASNASDRSSIKEKEGGDEESRYTGLSSAPSTATLADTAGPANLSRKPSLAPRSASGSGIERDTRTQQLSNLLESVQRLFTRLSTADLNTLNRRLQRQHLTGDVGHLARTTVNSILRDVDGMREHFRRLVEQEARARDREKDDCGSSTTSSSNLRPDGSSAAPSESMLARREFFALIKMFKDLFTEMGRLRTCINEVHLQPSSASRLLQEHLGLEPMEEKGLLPGTEWLSKMWAAAPLGRTANASESASSSSRAASGVASGLASPGGAEGGGSGASDMPQSRAAAALRSTSGATRHAPRAEASVVSMTVAVAAGGVSAAEAGAASDPTALDQPRARPNPNLERKSLTRVQSRNLSGLFAGAASLAAADAGGWDVVDRREASKGLGDNARLGAGLIPDRGGPAQQRPLSRIVDDDEVSLHHGRSGHGGAGGDDFRGALLERTLRPRGLSDSSIHSTFLEHGDNAGLAGVSTARPSPVSRLITASTLALQASSSGGHATARGLRASDSTPAGVLSSPSISEDSASTAGNAGSKSASATGSFFPTLASLRPTASLAYLGLTRGNTSGPRLPSTSPTMVTPSLSASPSTAAQPATAAPHSPASPGKRQALAAARELAVPGRGGRDGASGKRPARKGTSDADELSQSYVDKRLQRSVF